MWARCRPSASRNGMAAISARHSEPFLRLSAISPDQRPVLAMPSIRAGVSVSGSPGRRSAPGRLPRASTLECPNMRSAAAFQSRMAPSRSSTTTPSERLSNMSAWRRSSCSACLRFEMSIRVPAIRTGSPASSRKTSPFIDTQRCVPPGARNRHSRSHATRRSATEASPSSRRLRSSGWTRDQTSAGPAGSPEPSRSMRSAVSERPNRPVRTSHSQVPTPAAASACRSRSSLSSSSSRNEKRRAVRVPIWMRSPSHRVADRTRRPFT